MTTATFEMIKSETTSDGVLILTLNDPATRNSLTEQLMGELTSEIDRFSSDPDLRVLVLTGEDPAFCSGANVRGFNRAIEQRERAGAQETTSWWDQLDPSFTAKVSRAPGGPEIVLQLHTLQKPSIAAVNGAAYGLGCGIALSCDFRVASEKARFSEAFVRNGLIPADGSAWQLPRLIGFSRTLWMQYTGEPIDGAEAARIGLANVCVPHEQTLSTALEMATKLAHGPLVSMSLIKQLVFQGFNQTLAEHMTVASRAQNIARTTEDHKEGVRAFLEKRQPNFKGR
jgi:2-(1,2-epoxy-1,2-dihydrophenyl)acetyl-CoA isomerase